MLPGLQERKLAVPTIEECKERLILQKLGSPRLQRENIQLQMIMIQRKIKYNRSIAIKTMMKKGLGHEIECNLFTKIISSSTAFSPRLR
jgi:hypothetical protein